MAQTPGRGVRFRKQSHALGPSHRYGSCGASQPSLGRLAPMSRGSTAAGTGLLAATGYSGLSRQLRDARMSVPSTALSSRGRGSGAWTEHVQLSRDAIYSMMEKPISKLRGAVRGRPGPHIVSGLLGSRNRAANFKTSQLNAGNFTAISQQNANYNYAARSVKG